MWVSTVRVVMEELFGPNGFQQIVPRNQTILVVEKIMGQFKFFGGQFDGALVV